MKLLPSLLAGLKAVCAAFPAPRKGRGGNIAMGRVARMPPDGYSLMLDGFSAWVEGRGEYLATGEDGLHNQRVLDAAYRSWRDGVRVSLV